MDGARIEAAWRVLAPLALGASLGFSATVLAADYPDVLAAPLGPLAPRYFPRGDADAGTPRALPPPRRLAGCTPRRVPVPTDAPDDPSYVGSAYGLGKPSYYGFTPPLGRDDPFGRPLRYCP